MPLRHRKRKLLRPRFSVPEILAWADAFHRRTGAWPLGTSGPVHEILGETWRRVDNALRYGLRGLPGGSSLPRLLAERRGVRNQGQLPPLRRPSILAWADSHRERTGAWPTALSGAVADAPGETWRAVDDALRVGVRGLPGGSSLARLLAQRRGQRNIQQLPRLTEGQILAWADAHRKRTGAWPFSSSGPVAGAAGESWSAIGAALQYGRRGLPGGSSLTRLLAQRRGVRPASHLPPLTLRQIRAWARDHRRRTGAWPTAASGPIPDAPGETWHKVHSALFEGYRGLPGGRTLAALLNGDKPGGRAPERAQLTVEQILAWADAHRKRTGAWPHSRSGPIRGAPGETWRMVDNALRTDRRGLAGGGSLVRLLAEKRGWRTRPYLPGLTVRRILAWADAHRRTAGAWPTRNSGPIDDAPGETWRGVDDALRQGLRGLPAGDCLARLLAARRGARNRTNLPRLSPELVLAWADAHRKRSGAWPTSESGPVADAAGETWKGVDTSLGHGHRGLPGGTSLARLLAERRGVRNRASLPPLTCAKIVGWAAAHLRRTGRWPMNESGPIAEAPGETWKSVDLALRYGYRGLPGGASLARLQSRP